MDSLWAERYYRAFWSVARWRWRTPLWMLHPETHIAIFPKMNHGELLIEHPEEVSKRIEQIINQ